MDKQIIDRPDLPQMLEITPAMLNIMIALKAGWTHGYHIMKGLSEGWDYAIGPGTTYRSIKVLLKMGLIEPTACPEPRRKAYRLTPRGDDVLRAQVEMLWKILIFAKAQIAQSDAGQ